MATVYLDVRFDGDTVTLRDIRRIWPNRKDFLRFLVEMCEEAGDAILSDENDNDAEIEVVLAR